MSNAEFPHAYDGVMSVGTDYGMSGRIEAKNP